jgi:hypothetical protein
MNDGGKGDARRPTDENKFRSNYDQIKWTVEEDEEFKRIKSRDGDSLPRRPTQSNDLAG